MNPKRSRRRREEFTITKEKEKEKRGVFSIHSQIRTMNERQRHKYNVEFIMKHPDPAQEENTDTYLRFRNYRYGSQPKKRTLILDTDLD